MIPEQIEKDEKNGIHKHLGELHWSFYNNKGENLSIICHDGSYGHEEGLFEIMPSWTDKEIETWGDQVKGYLTFEEVAKWIKKLKDREVRK